MSDETDTIFAPATGAGASAIAVIRISGKKAHDVLAALTDRPLPAMRHLMRRWIVDGSGEHIDDAMVVTFPEGASFTGEPMAEIHCHGSRAVLHAILDRLGGELGCRLAMPGEFVQRAFKAQLLDLSEVEGLADLIASETELQRRQALRIMSGELSGRIDVWRTALLKACALIEVTIDWVDEDVPEDVDEEVGRILQDLQSDLRAELSRSRATQRIRTGFEVAIVGPPNSGKSSLINYLAGRDAAIVSEIPGTTRDVIEVRYDLHGLPVIFLDTAGLRDSSDAIEQIGIDRARGRALAADLRLHLRGPDSGDEAMAAELVREGDVLVFSKADLWDEAPEGGISVRDGRGVEQLLDDLQGRLSDIASEAGLLAHLRHQTAVGECCARLEDALVMLGSRDPEIVAEELRAAAEKLEFVVGRIDTEAVLDTVFRSFCLGK